MFPPECWAWERVPWGDTREVDLASFSCSVFAELLVRYGNFNSGLSCVTPSLSALRASRLGGAVLELSLYGIRRIGALRQQPEVNSDTSGFASRGRPLG